jgi:hypothetical protein
MPYLTCDEARSLYNRIFGKAARLLFRLPGGTAAAIVTGWMSGSPAGAMAVARVASSEELTEGEATRLAGIACGVSPVYALSVMGVSLAGSTKIGWYYVMSQLIAQIVTGILFRYSFSRCNCICHQAKTADRNGSIIEAVIAVLKVGGYMVIFAAAMSLVSGMIGEHVMFISPVVDLPTGMSYLAENDLPHWISSAALGFGGLCIAFQNLDILSTVGVNSVYYIVQKLTCGVLCGFLCWLLCTSGKPVYEANTVVGGACVGILEVNLLVMTAFLLPITTVFLRKTSKKHFS